MPAGRRTIQAQDSQDRWPSAASLRGNTVLLLPRRYLQHDFAAWELVSKWDLVLSRLNSRELTLEKHKWGERSYCEQAAARTYEGKFTTLLKHSLETLPECTFRMIPKGCWARHEATNSVTEEMLLQKQPKPLQCEELTKPLTKHFFLPLSILNGLRRYSSLVLHVAFRW